MKISDLVFESSSCCGTCVAATVELPSGETVGIVPIEDGLYNLSYYNAAGLVRRQAGVTAEQVELLLP